MVFELVARTEERVHSAVHAYADLPKITIHLQVALTECLQESGRTLEVGRVGNPHL